MIPFLVFIFCLFLSLGGYLIATRGSDAKRRRLQQRLSEALLHSANTEDVEVVLARQELMSEIPWLNRTLVRIQSAVQLKRVLDQADLHITVTRLFMFSLMAGLLAGLAASMLTVSLLDLRLCVTAVLIQRDTGGNLAEILEKVAYTIRERFRILGDLKTLTTSSRMSAWLLCGLPIGVAFAVTALNPEYMSILWRDPRGHILIAVALMMQMTGMLIVRKILKIKI